MYTSAPMRVLMFGWELPPYNTGGLGVACYGLAKGLAHRGVNISFALPRKLSTAVPFMQVLSHDLQGVEVTAINSLLEAYLTPEKYVSLNAQIREEHLHLYGSSLYDESVRFADMATSWSKHQPHDVIHAHDWMTYQAGMKASQVSGKPLVAHVHATEYDRTGGYVDSRIAEIEYQGLNKADKVIAVSHYTKNIVNQYYSVPKDKIVVVHNGVDPVEFTPVDIRRVFPHDKVVLFVGRLTFQKGVEYFLRAAKKLLETNPHTVFLVVGDGDMYQKLVLDSAFLDIAHRVIFTGFLSGMNLKSVYRMADIFVMPSVSEPYGIVALEAIASGTPAIISKQSGVAETLQHVHKVDFWDVDKMANQMSLILNYPQTSKEMAFAARKEIEKMSWNQAAQKTHRVYHSLVN